MFRLSFDLGNFENVEEHPSVFVPACVGSEVRAQTCSCTRNLYSCVRRLVLAYMYLFFSSRARRFHLRMRVEFCIRSFFPAYAWR